MRKPLKFAPFFVCFALLTPNIGRGQTPDHLPANLLYLAEHGGPENQFLAGRIYLNGESVRKNDVEAMKWFRKAANKQWKENFSVVPDGQFYSWQIYVTSSQIYIGMMYEKGRGVAKDAAQAHAWYSTALKYGNEDAVAHISAIEAKMTDEQKTAAKEYAAAVFLKLNPNIKP